MILVGNVVNVGAILLYLTVSSLGPWIYVVRIIHGVAEASLFTALFTYGADVVPASRRTEGLALFGVSGLLPIAFGGILGDIVLSRAGFDELFLTAAAFAFGALVISLWLPERAPALDDSEEKTGYFAAIRSPDLLPIWFIIGVVLVRAHRLLHVPANLHRRGRHRQCGLVLRLLRRHRDCPAAGLRLAPGAE